jgi:hypothetical protein
MSALTAVASPAARAQRPRKQRPGGDAQDTGPYQRQEEPLRDERRKQDDRQGKTGAENVALGFAH